VSPRTRISLHTVLVFVFHTKHNTEGNMGFSGSYQFIPDSMYMLIGLDIS
jgi:hypothetical protein